MKTMREIAEDFIRRGEPVPAGIAMLAAAEPENTTCSEALAPPSQEILDWIEQERREYQCKH